MANRIATRRLLSSVCLVALTGVASAVALVQSQAQGPEIPKGTNVLFGRVLDAGTDTAVAGAAVTLNGFFDAAGRPPATLPQSTNSPGTSAPRSVMTNGDGYFFFRELPAGRYSVMALAFGYMNDSYPLHVVEIVNSDKPNAVRVRLWKYAAISGTVLDEQGEPMAGVPVTALRRVPMGGSVALRTAGAQVLTDDRGIYRLAQLSPGSYIVGALSTTTTLPASLASEVDAAASDRAASFALLSALSGSGTDVTSGEGIRIGESVLQRSGPPLPLAADGTMLSYATTFSPGTPIAADATVITLGSGEQCSAVDVALRLSPTVRVSGVVTGPGGPMTYLAIELLPPNAADTTDYNPAGVATARTDAVGAFTFLAVTPGQYTLKTSLVLATSLFATQPLTVGESDLVGLVVSMKPGLRISGRVDFKGSAGSAAPSPQNGVIGLRPIGAQSWRSSRGRPAADGTFVSGGDPPGRYMLIAQIPGWTLQSVSRAGRPVADAVVDLDAADVTGLVFTFSDKASRVSGSIVDARGATDADIDVIVFPADTTLWREGVLVDRRAGLMHATSAAAFEFSGLLPGEYYVAAVSARFTNDWQDPLFLDRLTSGATKFTLGEGEEKTVPLKTFTPRDR